MSVLAQTLTAIGNKLLVYHVAQLRKGHVEVDYINLHNLYVFHAYTMAGGKLQPYLYCNWTSLLNG